MHYNVLLKRSRTYYVTSNNNKQRKGRVWGDKCSSAHSDRSFTSLIDHREMAAIFTVSALTLRDARFGIKVGQMTPNVTTP